MELIKSDAVYHCKLTRKQIEEAIFAPHHDTPSNQAAIRPKNIRQHNLNSHNNNSIWRFIVRDTSRTIEDYFFGSIDLTLDQDFIVWTRQGTPSYQLAVVVDDHRHGVTDVMRRNDLLKSAAWQELIYRALGWESPNWHHLPLVLGPDGKRLAKRHGDTRLTKYKEQGVTPERIIAMIANWCNIQEDRIEMNAHTFSKEFDPSMIQTDDIVFTEKDETWLTA